jgi:hypothetical protein
LHELHQDYPESLAIIAWHTGDEFEFPGSTARDAFWGISGYPTVWFDGYKDVVGGYQPSSYSYYVPVMEERVPWPSNFEVFIEITPVEGTDYNVNTRIDIKHGNSTENLAGFVVLTETDIPSPGNTDQAWVARGVWPDATVGYPLDYSVETSYTWNTVVTIEDDYVYENCEVVVFIENMDTKEIYQTNSLMMTEVTTSFPPATNLSYELSGSDVILNWDEPITEALVGYNVYHAYDGGAFEVVKLVEEPTFTHVDPDWGMHQYYVTAVYVTEESEPTGTVEVVLTSIGEDISGKIQVYPNPASSRLNIKSPAEIYDVKVYNHVGQLVYDYAVSSKIVYLNTSQLNSGLYHVRIETAKGIVVESVVIE